MSSADHKFFEMRYSKEACIFPSNEQNSPSPHGLLPMSCLLLAHEYVMAMVLYTKRGVQSLTYVLSKLGAIYSSNSPRLAVVCRKTPKPGDSPCNSRTRAEPKCSCLSAGGLCVKSVGSGLVKELKSMFSLGAIQGMSQFGARVPTCLGPLQWTICAWSRSLGVRNLWIQSHGCWPWRCGCWWLCAVCVVGIVNYVDVLCTFLPHNRATRACEMQSASSAFADLFRSGIPASGNFIHSCCL